MERPARFVYFNAMNLAMKNSIKSTNTVAAITSKPTEFNLSPEALRVLVDISSQHSRCVCSYFYKLFSLFLFSFNCSHVYARKECIIYYLFYFSMYPTCSTMIKTSNDNWVASRLCNSREIYIVLNQKLTKLYDVDCKYERNNFLLLKSIFLFFFPQLKFKTYVHTNLEQYFFTIS